jgi:lipopolysaccharide cholinephosphotransferase
MEITSKIGQLLQFACSKVVIAKGLDREGYETDSRKKKLFMALCRLMPMAVFLRAVKGPKQKGGSVHCFLGAASRFSRSVFPASVFEKQTRLPFAGGMYPAPEDHDAVLRILYGDYMRLPPESERKCKEHAILVDLHRSYEHYETYRDGMKFDVHTRSIR